MRRRRANELKRQEELNRKKRVPFGRDLDGGEGGNEFVVAASAHEAKYVVSCGLRGRGVVVDGVVKASLGKEEGESLRRKKERAEKDRRGKR